MLGISPVTYNNHSKSLSFGYNKKDVDNDISFYKEQVEELDQFLSENYIPDKMKKPFKFFRTIANGAIDGLAVFGSTLMLASFVKKSGAKINSNKYVKNTVEVAKPMFTKVSETISNFGKVISDKFSEFIKTPMYQKFASTKLGKRLIVDASVLAVKSEDAASKVMKPIKNIDSDKAVKGTATVLGIGSGITGAYETSMRNDIKNDECADYIDDDEFENEDYRMSA